MIKKVLSLVILTIFVTSVSLNDLVVAQNQEFKKPTFEEIYQSYSFSDTANLAELVKYPEEDIKKESERLREKEKAEKLEIKTEQKKALAELKKGQKELKKNSDAIEKLRDKYTTTATVVENNKPRKDKRVDENALTNDLEYQVLSEERKNLECQVREWQVKSDKVVHEIKLEKVKTYYEVLKTQLDLLQKWPVALQKIEADKQSGKAAERKFANPENIGLRDLGFGEQSDDLKIWQSSEGKQFLEELKKKEYKDTAVKNYVVGLIKLVADNSDLKIPVDEKNIFIIDEDDVNAFAAPGGVWGINRGLLLNADNEAQLAGVKAHEIGHVTARHYHRMMKKAMMRQLMLLAVILITQNYWLYQGLGFGISLEMLGVSRAFEMEADTLGMQYLEKTGYDPMSFMSFFEKMGRDKGYVRQTSWFRTHPAFAERITNTLREYRYLTPKDNYVQNSSEFLEMQARLCVAKELEEADTAKRVEKQRRPSLTRGQQKKEEDADKQCGIQRTPPEQKNSPCNRPELSDFKDKVRAEVAAEKEKQEKVEEEPKPKLRRP
ncbi:MAG: M48 family metalloprotease [Candidatus Yanofskybacteria bacterium]|nr:M48 family metalloprotease [Candidatus Yanofskybacteria bacterium]